MDPEPDVARLAAGAAGAVDATALASRIDEDRRLVDLLDPGEQPHQLLRAVVLDLVRRGAGPDGDERTRKMAPDDGGVYVLVSDRRVRLVVSYGRRARTYAVDLDDLTGVSMQAVGGDRRIRLALDDTAYDVYPTDDASACEAAVAFLTDRIDGRPGSGDPDPLDRLERLADLRDRGAVTEGEFEAAKRDLLDEL